MSWSLPVTVSIGGAEYPIRSDYRAVLDALAVLQDTGLEPYEQRIAFLEILYPDWKTLPNAGDALKAAFTFINLGVEVPKNQPPKPQLVDWEKDVNILAPAVDHVLGYSCRRTEYLHWWEFVGAYYGIGRGFFSQIVDIRYKRAKGKKLEKWEKEFAAENAEIISLPKPISAEAEEFFKRLGV